MTRQARLSDTWTGVCYAHDHGPIPMTGWLLRGSGVCSSDGLAEVRLSDEAIGRCGHLGHVVTASSVVFDDGLPCAEIGDHIAGDCTGTIVEGSNVSDFY